MECNKSNGKFLKVKAKVSGFLIVKVEKRNTPKIGKYTPVIIKSRKNTITGLQYLINAFLTYMRGVPYTGATAQSSGIVLTLTTGQTYNLSILTPPDISATENSAIISFIAVDDSSSSYTATSEQLITTSAGYNIPIATANLTVTKNPDEILTLTWIITITISTQVGLTYIPTPSPQTGGWYCIGITTSCGACYNNSANSLYTTETGACSVRGLTGQYPQTSFITTQLFTDMFYNTYGKGQTNPFVSYSNGIIYIYTLYCMEYFIAGVSTFLSYGDGGVVCFFNGTQPTPIYLQIYMPSPTGAYVGVQIELTT